MSSADNMNAWIAAAALSLLLFAAGCLGVTQNGADSPKPSSPSVVPQPAEGAKPTDQPQPSGSVKVDDVFPYTKEVVATKLNVPWDMDIAPDGRIFVTERGGLIRVIEQGKLLEQPAYRFDAPFYQSGESGLLGLVLDRDFKNNRTLYVYHTYQEGGETRNRVVRMTETGNRIELDKVLQDNLPGARIHDGGRVKIGADGMLYVTSGDASNTSLAQDAGQLGGKILRIQTDGSIPQDNPFPGSPVYSLGHRNPQGLAWDPDTSRLFSTEHGQTAHDEINLIVPGANYGWPLIEGDTSEVPAKDKDKQGPGMLKVPLAHSGKETWAPSGITFITKGPWKGNLLAANLRGAQLLRIVLGSDRQSVQQVEPLLKGEMGRIRNVMEGPDGSIYFMTNNRDGRGNPAAEDDQLIRLKPVF